MRFLVLIISFACILYGSTAEAKHLRIVTSFSILADMTREVAGSDADITSLVPPNADVHAFEPAPSDVRTLAHADLFIVNGLGLEGWLERLTKASGFKGVVVVASKGISPLMNTGAPDPHAWQSVDNGRRYATTIRDALMQTDPEHVEEYRGNAERYIAQLDSTDEWIRSQIETVTPEKRRAIVSHNALQYFAKRYGIDFISPLGFSTEGDIAAGDLAHIVDIMRKEHIHAVFTENMADPRLVQQLIRDAGAVFSGTLYPDALSGPGGPAGTYIAMLRYNTKTLVEGMRAN